MTNPQEQETKGCGIGALRIKPEKDTPEARAELIRILTDYISKEMPVSVAVKWGRLPGGPR